MYKTSYQPQISLELYCLPSRPTVRIYWLRGMRLLYWLELFVLVIGGFGREGEDQDVICASSDKSRDEGVCVDPRDCAVLQSVKMRKACGDDKICCRRSQLSRRRRRSAGYNDDVYGCGSIAYTGKIFNGGIAGIDEFPWAALLLYKKDVPRCGAVLISRNYVVSAAHCLTGSGYNRHGPLKYVRLREYDLNNDQDCVLYDDVMDCSDEEIDVPPERIILHPDYDANSIHQHHDIALIEIQLTAPYSDFLSPICLPRDAKGAGQQKDKTLTVTGWGRTDFFKTKHGEISSPVKMKASLPFVTQARCSAAFRSHDFQLIPGQICAGGRHGDSCIGDSGSPLMFFDVDRGVWTLSGIVSQGPSVCGSSDLPGIYTNVVKYLPWIKEITKLEG